MIIIYPLPRIFLWLNLSQIILNSGDAGYKCASKFQSKRKCTASIITLPHVDAGCLSLRDCNIKECWCILEIWLDIIIDHQMNIRAIIVWYYLKRFNIMRLSTANGPQDRSHSTWKNEHIIVDTSWPFLSLIKCGPDTFFVKSWVKKHFLLSHSYICIKNLFYRIIFNGK